VCNGDVLTSLDLGAMVAFHDEHEAEATISLSEVEDPSAFGVVPTRPDGRVLAFVEKPPPNRAPTRWINAGTYVLEPQFLDRVPPRLQVSVERETFPRLLDQRGSLFGFKSTSYWLDIGTPQKFIKAQTDVLGGCVGLPPAPGAVERDTGVWVQGEVALDAAATVKGACLFGDGARVAAGAALTDTVLGRDVTIGEDARIDDAVVLPGAHVGAGVTLADAIVGPGAVLEAGAMLSDHTIVGAGATVRSGTRLSAAKVPPGEGDA
jgi:NDP-sugar pyrophosphorylase family protein